MTIKSPRRWRRLIVLRGSSRSLKNWSIETTSSELTLRILRSPWPTNQVNWKAIGLPLIQLPRYPKLPKVRVSPAQDGEKRFFCYANSDLRKDQQNDEILEFARFWKERTGRLPEELIFDSKLTTYANLNRLNRQGVQF